MRYLVLLLLLTGCSSFTAKPDSERIILAPKIWWITVDDPEKECLSYGTRPAPLFYEIQGCAMVQRYDQSCTIITGKNTSMEILGHEMRHCFEGNFHE